MKNIFTSLAALAIATTAFAQGELLPAGGTYYPTDAMNQGYISAQFEDAVELPTASITYAGVAHEATVEPVGFSGMTYRVNVADVMDGQAANTAFTLSVGELSGEYVWQPVFPLTGVTPVDGTVLTSKEGNVVFNFSPAVKYSGIRITSGTVTTTLPGGSGSAVSVALQESYWGAPVAGVNTITVALTGVTADGVSISNASGSEGTIMAHYTIEDKTSTVTFLGVDPDEDTTLANELWDYWNVVFMFSDAVELTDENETAVIQFHLPTGEVLSDYTINVATEEIYADWNPRAGYYGVEVPSPEIPSAIANVYDYVTITLQGIAYNGTLLATQPSALYYAPLEDLMARKSKKGTAGIASSLVSENGKIDVYNIQGALVKTNISERELSNLPAGLYIINGKKVVIK